MKYHYRITKRPLALLLALTLTLSLLPVGAFAASGADGHWAQNAIETCHTYGIMNGDGNGAYRPDDDITRAEFAALINRAFGYDALSVPELTAYTDVPADKWYANDMVTAIALGIIEGYGNGIAAPEDTITREQAVVILTKIMRLTPAASDVSTRFTDIGSASEWARNAVLTMEQSGYVMGCNNQFMPTKNLTRGEAAQMLVNVFGVIIDSEFDAQGKTYQNVTIRKPGVVIKNANIKGDLFITEGVGDGDVWLDTVQISGRLLAAGGGENSIHVHDITVGDNVVVDKPSAAGDEPVRFRAIQSNNNTVIFEGTAREVIVTEDIIIIIDNDGEKTVFNMFKPEDGTEKPTVIISESAAVEKVTAFVPAEIQGGGEVGKVEAHTDGVTVDAGVKVDPQNVEAAQGVEVNVGGETVTGTGITEPTTRPSDPVTPPSDPTPAPTPDPTPAPTTPPGAGGGDSGGGTTTYYWSISFNGNGNTGGTVPGSISVVRGNAATLPGNTGALVKTGYTFGGWAATTGAASGIGGTYTPTANTTLYAVWTLSSTAVAWSALTANGTSNAMETTELTLTFDVDPTTLAASDITVTGATKGTLTGSGTTRTLAISGITVANGANVTVAIANPTGFTISGSPKTVAVYRAPAPNATVSASLTGSAAPTAGSDTTVTFTVKNSTGATDTTFTGNHTVTVSGISGTAADNALNKAYTVNFTGGVGTLDLAIQKAAAHTVSFSVADVTAPNAGTVTITPVHAALTTLSITTAAAFPLRNGTNAVPFTTNPQITLLDAYGNICTSDSATQVTMTVQTGAVTLDGGTTTVTASGGVAAFNGLTLAANSDADVPSVIFRYSSGSKTVDSASVSFNAAPTYLTTIDKTALDALSGTYGDAHAGTTFTIQNTGNTAITDLAIAISNTTDFTLTNGGSGITLAAGASRTVTITPQSTLTVNGGAAYTTNLTVTSAAHVTANSTASGLSFTVNKANPTVTAWPSGLTATYGQQKSEISLTSYTNSGGTPGTFAWEMSSESVGSVGTPQHSMKFLPTDQSNYNNATQNVTITVGKATGATVSAPTAKTVIHNSIEVNTVTASTGQDVEYAISTSNSPAPPSGWQDSAVFGSLTAQTDYYVFARAKENTNYNTGTAAVSGKITTEADITNLTIGAPSALTYSNSTLGKLTPITNGSAYTERTATFTVAVSGFTNDADANGVGLTITTVPGLTFSGHSATGNASSGTKTFTVTVTLADTTAFASGTATINITGLSGLSGNYTCSDTKNTNVSIIDGRDAARQIPVNSTNVAAFNTYANTTNGLTRHYKQTANIDLTGAGNWTPIGDSSNQFTGTYDGGGHTITGLTFNTTDSFQGLFSSINGGIVQNLGLVDVDISGGSYIGGVAGSNSGGTIQNCYVTGAIIGTATDAGGVVGCNENSGVIQKSYFFGSVSGGSYVGGIFGSNWGAASRIENCYSAGSVTGTSNHVGGVTGYNEGVVQNCFSTSTVSGKQNSSGVVGYNKSGKVQNCVALNQSVTVSDSSSTIVGRVVVNSAVDGGTSSNNYAWSDMTVMANSAPKASVGDALDHVDGKAITAAAAKTDTTWTTPGNWNTTTGTAWDFADTWVWDGTNMPALKNVGTAQSWPGYLVDAPTTVTLGAGSQGTAGDEQITGLASTARYIVYDGTRWHAPSGGTLGSAKTSMYDAIGAAAGGYTTLTGLTNGTTYTVYEVAQAITATAAFRGYNTVFDISGLTDTDTYGTRANINSSMTFIIYTGVANGAAITGGTPIADGQTFGSTTVGGKAYTLSNTTVANSTIAAAQGENHVTISVGGASFATTITVTVNASADPNDGMDGTAGKPYKVYDVTTLGYVGKGNANPAGYKDWTLSVYYEQIDNINMSTVGNWTPIGSSSTRFTGTYDGGGHTISGLTITAASAYQGLFGFIGSGGAVKNVGLVNVNISVTSSSGNSVGGVAGMNEGTVQNCYVTGSVSGNETVGGVAGSNYGMIQNCYFTGSVNGTSSNIGGVAGYNSSTVQNCYATGSVSGTSSNIGGVAGYNRSTVQNCVALNQSVTTSANVTTIGRVVGSNTTMTTPPVLANNYAWSGMKLYKNTTTEVTPSAKTHDGIDGADITAVQAKTDTTWTTSTNWNTTGTATAWDFPGTWVWDSTGVNAPALKNVGTAQSWPVYLVDAGPTSLVINLATVTVNIDGSGMTEVIGVEDGYTFIGETVTVTATPDEGWTFAYWTDENGEIVSYDAEYTFIIEGDVTLTAVFSTDEAEESGDSAKFQATDPRKESDPIIVPDNDDESDNPDGDGGNDNDGDSLSSGTDLTSGSDGGRMTPQEAIATLNNLLAMCGSVTQG